MDKKIIVARIDAGECNLPYKLKENEEILPYQWRMLNVIKQGPIFKIYREDLRVF